MGTPHRRSRETGALMTLLNSEQSRISCRGAATVSGRNWNGIVSASFPLRLNLPRGSFVSRCGSLAMTNLYDFSTRLLEQVRSIRLFSTMRQSGSCCERSRNRRSLWSAGSTSVVRGTDLDLKIADFIRADRNVDLREPAHLQSSICSAPSSECRMTRRTYGRP